MPLLEKSKHVSPDILILAIVYVIEEYKIVISTLMLDNVVNAIEMLTDSGLF